MSDYIVYGTFGFFVLCLGGLGYFTIWRLTDETARDAKASKKLFLKMIQVFNQMKRIVAQTRQDFVNLRAEIQMQKSDSSRLVEWLDKEEKRRKEERELLTQTLEKHFKINERESALVKISENLRLLTKK